MRTSWDPPARARAQIERYLKQAIVDKAPVVASAALVSALHLLGNNTEIVKRWINEIQEAAQSKSSMVQVRRCLALAALKACSLVCGAGAPCMVHGVLAGPPPLAWMLDLTPRCCAALPCSSMPLPYCTRCAPATAWPSASW